MRAKAKEAKMGRFSVEFDVANFEDISAVRRGALEPSGARRRRIRGVVDTGAMHLVLPASVVKALDVPISGKISVRYADGRVATRDKVDGVYVEIQGRGGTFLAIVEPKRKEALIGAVVLETFDFLPDCTKQRLVPRDPTIILSEIE
jgi:predicted aspartyl protease